MSSPPGLTVRTTLASMAIGDCIVCRYTALSGAVGYFSDLGTSVLAEIPVSGSATPDGTFYLIKVARGLLIADRVVQHSIPWNTLNTGKVIQNKSLLDDFARLPATADPPTSVGNSIIFTSNGNSLAVATGSTPYIYVYNRNEEVLTKLTNPVTLPTGSGNDIDVSSDGVYYCVAHTNTPYITIYKRAADVLTKLTNPTSLPLGTGQTVAFSQDTVYLAVGHSSSPSYICIYKRAADVFTKLALPTAPSGPPTDCAFSFNGDFLVYTHPTSPYLSIYKRSVDTFTRQSNPTGGLPTGIGNGVAFSPDDVYMAIGHNTTPFITIYKRDGDVFTKLANPSVLPSGIGMQLKFSSDGVYLAMGSSVSPFMIVYKRSGDIFTKITDPAVIPASISSASFSSNNKYLALAGATPYLYLYRKGMDNILMRSAFGGAAFADVSGNSSTTDLGYGAFPTINEWDDFIVNSTLGGKITAGDNAVWNWSSIYSLCRETPILAIAASTNRIYRGSVALKTFAYVSSATSSSAQGLRPVFEYLETDASASTLYY